MPLKAKFRERSFRAILLIVAPIILNLFAYATPIKDIAAPLTITEAYLDVEDFEALSRYDQTRVPRGYRAPLDKRANDPKAKDYAWVYHRDGSGRNPTTVYAYGSMYTNPKVQYGSITLFGARGAGGHGVVYNAVLDIFSNPVELHNSNGVSESCTTQIDGVVGKYTPNRDGYVAIKIIALIDDDAHLPIVYLNTLIPGKGSLGIMEKLDGTAQNMWKHYRSYPFDVHEMMTEVTDGV